MSSNQQQYDLPCRVGSSSQCLLWVIENDDKDDDDEGDDKDNRDDDYGDDGDGD